MLSFPPVSIMWCLESGVLCYQQPATVHSVIIIVYKFCIIFTIYWWNCFAELNARTGHLWSTVIALCEMPSHDVVSMLDSQLISRWLSSVDISYDTVHWNVPKKRNGHPNPMTTEVMNTSYEGYGYPIGLAKATAILGRLLISETSTNSSELIIRLLCKN